MRARDARERVVITGMGAVTPLGLSVAETWQALVAGRSGIARITRFEAKDLPIRIAGEVKGFDPAETIDFKEARRMARTSHLALAAAAEAMADAGLGAGVPDGEAAGVVMGTGAGGFDVAVEAWEVLCSRGWRRVNPFMAAALLTNMPAHHISLRYQCLGYNATVVTGCAAGTQAIGEAAEVIRRGAAELVLAGGVEALIHPILVAALGTLGVLAGDNEHPEEAVKPFDARRDGFAISEGAAVVVLERLDRALARGARIYGEVLGYAANGEGRSLDWPDPEGGGAIRCMRRAMEKAGISPDEVDYVKADGAGTQAGDAAETRAIKAALGARAYEIPVSSPKSMLGHALGGAGAIGAVVCAKTLTEGVIPGTINYEVPDAVCDLDYVPGGARAAEVRVALSNSFGLGGQNACLVLGRYEGQPGAGGDQARPAAGGESGPRGSGQGRGPEQRVVVTGLGAVTPLGLSVAETWEGLVAGRSGIGPVSRFDASDLPIRIAGEVKGFDPRLYVGAKAGRRMPRCAHLALAAATEAMADAGLGEGVPDRARAGVVMGTANGGAERGIEGWDRLKEKGLRRTSPYLLARMLPNMPAQQVSQRFGCQGYNGTVTTACASGTQSIGEAAEVIRRGDADLMLAGGAESMIHPSFFSALIALRVLASDNAHPERAMKPFDARRDGFACGEGAAVVVLERLDRALARGARIYAEVIGYAANTDAHHIAIPDPVGAGASRCVRRALADAGIGPEAVDYINAHGPATEVGDQTETMAIKAAFGAEAYRVPISSTKSMIGHASGAAGAIEAVVCVQTMVAGVIHPTINYAVPDPDCDLDYVPNVARAAEVEVTLSNSFGLGGQNACLVLRRW